MTLEEFQEFLKDDGNRQVFIEVAKSIGFESQEEIQGLRNKRDELLGTNKKMKEKIAEYEKMLDKIDIEEYNDLKLKNDNKSQGDEFSKLQREFKKLSETYEKVNSEKTALEAEYNNSIISSTISSILDEVGIDPVHKGLLTTAYKGKAKIERDDSGRNVIIDDEGGLGLPAKEFFKKFVETETGKIYVRQPENRGASSGNIKPSGSVKTMKLSDFNTMLPKDRASFMASGGKIID